MFYDSIKYQPIEVFHFRVYVTDPEPISVRESSKDG